MCRSRTRQSSQARHHTFLSFLRGPTDAGHLRTTVTNQAEILDLDAEVLAEHIAAITGWLPIEAIPALIVDLGCGTGAGTFALLARFPEARVTAVDSSAAHLQRLREKACAEGVDKHVRTVQADLDADWPDLGTPELVWASASMHHMADPDRALRKVHDTLEPGGLFAVVELAGFLASCPRTNQKTGPAWRGAVTTRATVSTPGRCPSRADWGPKLIAAGFTLEGERTLNVNIEGSRSEAVGRYALASPHSILRRDDLAVRTERAVWAARHSS